MKIDITYEVPTACGFNDVKRAVAHSLKEAEELCKAIETVGYKITDVTRDVYESAI